MMTDSILAALAARKDLSDWLLVERRRSSSELYLVGRESDVARSVEKLDYTLLVFVDGEREGAKTRGDAKVCVHPSMSRAEIDATIDRAVFAASKSHNPWYPLPDAAPALTALPPSGFAARPTAEWMPRLRDILLGAEDGRRQGSSGASRINSLELYLDRIDMRVRNSRGVDAAWTRHAGYTEYVVEASGQEGEVELFDELHFSEPDENRLSGEIRRALDRADERARARPLPALGDLPLVLKAKEAAEILGWFFANADVGRSWLGSSPLTRGASVHGEGARPGDFDPLELALEAVIPGHPFSAPFDGEGVPLARRELIKDGVLLALCGESRYAHYLNLPCLGSSPLFSVGAGGLSAAEIAAAPHLEVGMFSDFRVDPDSGDFGGEIRLGWHFDGKERIPVTGGSIAGSLFENRGRLRTSRERTVSGPMYGPESVLLPAVSITGTHG